jgi:rsbT antagonist protein RsbS
MERIPILRIGNILLVSIQVDLQDHVAIALHEDLAEHIVESSAEGVLIDISALELVDSFVGRMISTIASVSRVLDAETVVVGMRPAVAITLVELGLSLSGVRTALDLDRGLEMLTAARPEAEEEAEGDADAESSVGCWTSPTRSSPARPTRSARTRTSSASDRRRALSLSPRSSPSSTRRSS